MKIGFVINDLQTEYAAYTTTCLAMEANNLGHETCYINVEDFEVYPNDSTRAKAYIVPPGKHRSAARFLEIMQEEVSPTTIIVDELDVLMLRNDPAQDVIERPWARLAGINFGRLAMRHGVITLNNPDSLARGINKMYSLAFPHRVRPETLITRDHDEIVAFQKAMGGTIVLKPLAGSGGRNVFLLRPQDAPNLHQMIEAISHEGYVIAQEYLPAIKHGDTRLFLINGRPLCIDGEYAAIRRIRPGEDIRSNMTVGGHARKAQITEEMLEIAETVRPRLVQDGMFLVGLDIVGDKLVEINVFSPGGLNTAQELTGVNFCREIIELLEHKADYVRRHDRHFDHVEIATY
ncbi:MAG TPA: glutathione synthase [Gammaproteobacteria bacterium]|nr:glutathione synthase [Gammaproteobacteria bacterium]